MKPDNRNDIFQADYKILADAKKALVDFYVTGNSLQPQFEEMALGYKKLLRQSSQLINIADRQQVRLLNLQQDLALKNKELEALSITDGLTGIANRRRFDEVLAQEYARHTRSGAPLSLVLLDVDHFKAFNDTYGHVKGDDCLCLIASVLKKNACRPADLAARYGGEEFSCVLPETDGVGAVIIAENICSGIMALAIPHMNSSAAKCVTASMGVVTACCTQGGNGMDLVTRADELLYQAKSGGRNRVESAGEGAK